MMRLFYAVNLDRKSQGGVRKVQETLRHTGIRGRWIPEENFHITLHFVGEVHEKAAVVFIDALDRAAVGISSFSLFSGEYDFFKQRGGRLIYCTVRDPSGNFAAVSAKLKACLGIREVNRPLIPHITLVRKAKMDISEKTPGLPPLSESVEMRIRSIELMKSRSLCGGVIYTPLHSFSLEKKNEN